MPRILIALPSFALTLALAPVAVGAQVAPFGAADVPPTVASSVPSHTATEVPTNTPISVTFSESVDTLSANWFTFDCGSGTPTLTPSAGPATTFTLTPSGPLGQSKLCNLVVIADQIRDRDGTPDLMAFNEQIQFETVADTLPEVTATVPTDQATDVSRAANLSVTFNEPVTAPAAAFAIECPIGPPRAFALSSADNRVFVLNPNADLPASTACRLHIDHLMVTDQDGTTDNLDRDFSASFTTAALIPPALVSSVPAKNATNFPPAGDMEVVFNTSVTLAPGAFTLTCVQSTGIALTHATTGTTFAIETGTVLVGDDSCTLRIEADAVTSGDGLHPDSDEVVNFTVIGTPIFANGFEG